MNQQPSNQNDNGANEKQVLQLMDIKNSTEALDKLQEGIDKGVRNGAYSLAETNMYLKSIAYLSKLIEHLDALQRTTLIKTVESFNNNQLSKITAVDQKVKI